jgi:hypothetical protein
MHSSQKCLNGGTLSNLIDVFQPRKAKLIQANRFDPEVGRTPQVVALQLGGGEAGFKKLRGGGK